MIQQLDKLKYGTYVQNINENCPDYLTYGSVFAGIIDVHSNDCEIKGYWVHLLDKKIITGWSLEDIRVADKSETEPMFPMKEITW